MNDRRRVARFNRGFFTCTNLVQVVKRIVAKWKMFQRRASASFRDDAKKAAAPAPGRRGV